jgi:hypothetical protein
LYSSKYILQTIPISHTSHRSRARLINNEILSNFMLVTRIINAGVLKLTKSKQEHLDHEYNGFQWWMQFNVDKDILSQHKRAKGWYYDKNKIKYKDYPLVIPYKQVWLRNRNTRLTKHWIKISVRKRKGIGLFKCENCNYEVNADYNASRNILRMPLDYMFSGRAPGLSPKIAPEVVSTKLSL